MSDVEADNKHLPDGFPEKVDGPLVWTAGDLQGCTGRYIFELSQEDVQSIEIALQLFKGSNHNPHEVDSRSFQLPKSLSLRLRRTSKGVHSGLGFAILRGLKPNKYTDEDNILIYAGIASHVGDRRTHLTHIYDRSPIEDYFTDAANEQAKYPPNEMSIEMNFHTDVDSGDILSLYAQNLSRSGGKQYLASFWQVYNILAKTSPECLKTLSENWRFEMPQAGVIHRPIIYFHKGKLQLTFAAAFVTGSAYLQRSSEAPQLIAKQYDAIQKLTETCRAASLELTPECGDILFVNNLCILHARDAFVNDLDTGKNRHLLSLMLQDTQLAWDKPQGFNSRVEAAFEVAATMDQPMMTLNEYDRCRRGECFDQFRRGEALPTSKNRIAKIDRGNSTAKNPRTRPAGESHNISQLRGDPGGARQPRNDRRDTVQYRDKSDEHVRVRGNLSDPNQRPGDSRNPRQPSSNSSGSGGGGGGSTPPDGPARPGPRGPEPRHD